MKSLKSQGSSKIGAHCTSTIIATQTKNCRISAEICRTHYRHTNTLGHSRLPAVKRTEIAGQISQGITFQRILDNIRDSVSTKFDRIHLITRKDIANIEREFGLKCVEKHSDDATSLLLWVEEMKSRGSDNPVLVYKQQGEQPPMGCDY